MFKKVIILLGFCFIFVTPAHAIDGFVTITSPNSGTYTEGDTVNVTWDTSSNIDNVTIMYMTDPHHGNYVASNIGNPKSYSWKVDVGNTTNTQFYLWIIAYETGKGSITNTGGTFTVNQNPPIYTSPSSTPTPTPSSSQSSSPAPTSSSNKWSGIIYPSNYPSPSPRATIKPLALNSLILWSEFTFEGSHTTDLSSITDPKNVTNFTLDTADGFTFIFSETLDLTTYTTLSALQNTSKYWVWEEWFIWIEWEWWIKYDFTKTINVEYKNESLTAYAPSLVEEPKPSPSGIKTKASTPRKLPQILGAEAGKVKIALNDGTPIKIKPRVELDTPKSPVGNPKIDLTGKTSHSNLTWTLNFNGNKSNITPQIDAQTGSFIIPISNLIKGANTFVLTYTEPDSDAVSLEPVTVIYDSSFWSKYGQIVLTVLLLGLVFAAGLLFPKILKMIHKIYKIKKHK
jgi:hypothetical protein